MWNRALNWVSRNHDRMIFSGGIVGANFGVFNAAIHDESYILYGTAGFLAGCGVGGLLPLIVPVTVLSSPGYLVYKLKENGFYRRNDMK